VSKAYHRRKIVLYMFVVIILFVCLTGVLVNLMIFDSEKYIEKANELHERERDIKAARGKILDRNGVVIASNKTVCTISVVYNQIENHEEVIEVLSKELELSKEEVTKKVMKVSSREKIKSNVLKEVGDRIREYNLPGVKIDEDYKRYYPYSSLASKVLGFTGADNQGIVGLEVTYEDVLKGKSGKILTVTDARGIELEAVAEKRLEPVAGKNLVTSIDVNIQKYAEQAAKKVLESKEAKRVSVIIMNPQNGEIYAMVNVPEYDLNNPFELNYILEEDVDSKEYQNLLNKMWRNESINDTYEPGSTFKIFTATAGLETKVITPNSTFSCPGYKIVDDRRIRCHKAGGHGAENFVEGTMNSCNPVFIDTGLRLGVDKFYEYFEKLGLFEKTGVDLPGEAGSIMHKKENVGNVELATLSFGQSFQITPLQLLRMTSAVINGGNLITPHLGIKTTDNSGNIIDEFEYDVTESVITLETCETMKGILEKVVAEGTGKNGYVEGYAVGGKTATSEKLPRGNGKYISSYLGFAPANNPQVIGICIIDEPEGIYYGGTVAAPVMQEIFDNILPYLGIEKSAK
ncbi:MAG: peptidoglycan glycosyltransferase, partial [Lachnospiraceae bacterium]|nr:peptidoglycan glycosyltransferase [Lachnospiraceae bacterium]